MDKVVILARVSTQSQDYERQIKELSEYCDRVGWEVSKVVANKVSGAAKNADRTEIRELVEYVKSHRVERVVCTEISRIGRNTLEALKIINYLNDSGVSLFIKNYNISTLNDDGKVNPVTSLICTILLEISSMERLAIKERMESGRNQYIAKCRQLGVKMGRPASYRKSIETYKTQYAKEIILLRKGISLRNICAITKTSINTLQKLKNMLKST